MIARACCSPPRPRQTALDAERAFAADAQQIGQWTAFRNFADRDAVMFIPQAVVGADFLKDRKDPPNRSAGGRRTASVVRRPHRGQHRAVGRARTASARLFHHRLAARRRASWSWIYDGGDRSTPNAPARPSRQGAGRRACSGKAPGAPIIPPPPLTSQQGAHHARGQRPRQSADKTLGWDWKVAKDGVAPLPRLPVEWRALRPGPGQRRARAQ